jgi:hypothetical protein
MVLGAVPTFCNFLTPSRSLPLFLLSEMSRDRNAGRCAAALLRNIEGAQPSATSPRHSRISANNDARPSLAARARGAIGAAAVMEAIPAVYFDFFGTRFFVFDPDRPDGPASSPWHGQASLNASIARVRPGTSNRSGFWSRYRSRTLALSKTLPCAGGHARTSDGRFGEKDMAVSIMPSHAPADRASPSS